MTYNVVNMGEFKGLLAAIFEVRLGKNLVET
jgi:hypothetical protein